LKQNGNLQQSKASNAHKNNTCMLITVD